MEKTSTLYHLFSSFSEDLASIFTDISEDEAGDFTGPFHDEEIISSLMRYDAALDMVSSDKGATIVCYSN
jgi:hypothetical protein